MDRLSFPESIETERLLLQRLRYEDAEEIFYTYASKPEVTRYLSWPTHTRIEDTRAFLRFAITHWNEGKDYSFSIRMKNSGKLAGSFGIINDHGKVQFGYALSPTYWGKGIATEACRKMMDVLKTFPLISVGTFVDTENIASRKVLIKSGLQEDVLIEKWFLFVNQENQYKDCILFRLPLQR